MGYKGKFTGAQIDEQMSKIENGQVVIDNTDANVTENGAKPVSGSGIFKAISEAKESLESIIPTTEDIGSVVVDNTLSEVVADSNKPVSGAAVHKSIMALIESPTIIYDADELKSLPRKKTELGENGIPSYPVIGSDVFMTGAELAFTPIIPIEAGDIITYPTYKTTSQGASVIVDANDKVLSFYINETEEAGTMHTMVAPEGAKYFYFAYSNSLQQIADVKVTVDKRGNELNLSSLSERMNEVERVVKPRKIYKDDFKEVKAGYIVINSPLNGLNVDDVFKPYAGNLYTAILDVEGYQDIYFPVVKSTSQYGCVVTDAEGVILQSFVNTDMPTGTKVHLMLPGRAKWFYMYWGGSIYQTITDTYTELSMLISSDGVKALVDESNNINDATPNDLVLGAICIKTSANRMPYQAGYLFHTWNSNELFYGGSFDTIKSLGSPSFVPKTHTMAVSPEDGRIVAAKLNSRGGLEVFHEGVTYSLPFTDMIYRPMGWLYNSGVEFIKDGAGNEFCLFAEYSNAPANSQGANGESGKFQVWRGKYPYTSESDWSVVFEQNWVNDSPADRDNSITHFHQVSIDPWSGIIYLTSGDDSDLSKWWYSTDNGLTWNLLTSGTSSGWEAHICRNINFIFTKGYIYFATDKGTNHCLNRIQRDSNGLIDISTREKVVDLPEGQATNMLCWVDSPCGIFMFDRIDVGYDDYYDKPLNVQYYDIDEESLKTILKLKLVSPQWGGHRGRTYSMYCNGKEPRPAMGFAIDSPCIFDIASLKPSEIGTIAYLVGGRTLYTL